jgi:hypothetical protein
MNIDEYAQLEQKTGSRLIKKGDIWWRQVRPFFYRPLLPFESFEYQKIVRCFPSWQIIQFPVKEKSRVNSQLNMIVFDDIQSYQIDTLRKDRRRDIRKAIKNGISIQRIREPDPFIAQAYPVYQSFYKRTHYSYQKSRNQLQAFGEWVYTQLAFPDVYLLGAYLEEELIAIETVCLVDNALIGKSMINSQKSIPLRAQDLLLHYTREELAQKLNVDLIFTGMIVRDQGVNNFKLWRGGKIASVPSHLRMPSPVKFLLKRFRKSEYTFLIGELPK